MNPSRAFALATALAWLPPSGAQAQTCRQEGARVLCDDGRAGIFAGGEILWPDGTRSSPSPHPSVTIDNPAGLTVGQGVFVGSPGGGGLVPLDDPNGAYKRNCAILNAVPYCH